MRLTSPIAVAGRIILSAGDRFLGTRRNHFHLGHSEYAKTSWEVLGRPEDILGRIVASYDVPGCP